MKSALPAALASACPDPQGPGEGAGLGQTFRLPLGAVHAAGWAGQGAVCGGNEEGPQSNSLEALASIYLFANLKEIQALRNVWGASNFIPRVLHQRTWNKFSGRAHS